MFNPFDLRGPEFLVFYAILGVTTWIVEKFLINNIGRAFARSQTLEDPYLIAALRAGIDETIRLGLISLVDRGIIKADSNNKIFAEKKNIRFSRNLEEQIIKALPDNPANVYNNRKAQEAAMSYETELEKTGLLAGEDVKRHRKIYWIVCSLLLGLVSAAKIIIALQRGRKNIWFLVMLTAFFLWLLFKAYNDRSTPAGKDMLAQCRKKFEKLKKNKSGIKPGGATNELILLGAVFGVETIPATTFAYVKDLSPKTASFLTGGSGCGSSGCSNGGGCGSGCGGCGGCGG